MHYKIVTINREGDVGPYLSQVSDQRRSKILRFKHRAGQWQSLQAYLLLRQMLHDNYAIDDMPEFCEGEHGKPELVGHNDVHFNMSHCQCAVACVVSDSPCGIDVERIPERVKEDLCRYVFNAEECSLVLSAERPEVEFARLWTMKEALVKLTGTGLSGREQLQPLLVEYAGKVQFKTEIDIEHGFVTTVAEWI